MSKVPGCALKYKNTAKLCLKSVKEIVINLLTYIWNVMQILILTPCNFNINTII